MKKAAKKKKKTRSFSIATIVEMFFSLLMIPLGLAAAQGFEGTKENIIEMLAFLMLAEFVLLSVTTLLRATARRYRTQIPQRRRLDFIFAGLFLACAVAIFIWPTLLVMTITGVIEKIAESVVDGNSHYYLLLKDSEDIYDVNVSKNLSIIRYNVGDTIELEYTQGADRCNVIRIK